MRKTGTVSQRARLRSGFTLLELMIVIVIIGILAAIMIPNFIKAKYRAHMSSCLSNERTIVTALEFYRNDHKTYPPSGPIAPGHPVFDMSFISADAGKCPSNQSPYSLESTIENFTLSCNGIHHLAIAVTAGYPQWSPTRGSTENP